MNANQDLEMITYKKHFDSVILHIKTLDYQQEALNIFNKYYIIYEKGFCELLKNGSRGSNFFRCVFGEFFLTGYTSNSSVEKSIFQKNNTPICRECSNGIEIIGFKASKKSMNGKYTYQNVSIKHLKNACKINGIKGYSSADKEQLISLLLKL